MVFYICHESGVINRANAKTLAGAKREATREKSFGGGSVWIEDENRNMLAMREFWQIGNSYGWNKWNA
jgi:hypothetical protein